MSVPHAAAAFGLVLLIAPSGFLVRLVSPGLTGWAQIKYAYGASIEDARQKLQYDLFYVKNQSLILDAIVLFETIKIILFGRGAH